MVMVAQRGQNSTRLISTVCSVTVDPLIDHRSLHTIYIKHKLCPEVSNIRSHFKVTLGRVLTLTHVRTSRTPCKALYIWNIPISTSLQIQNIQLEREMALASNRSLAERNLDMKPRLEQERERLVERYSELEEVRDRYKQRCSLRGKEVIRDGRTV